MVERVRTLGLACIFAALLLLVVVPLASAQSGYRLGAGDKLKVTVFGEEDASGEYEIDATGAISARLIGRLPSRADRMR